MAIAILMEFADVEPGKYDAVVADLNLGGKAAPGGIFHVAGPIEGGWRIVDVWDSQEVFDAFMRDRLAALLQKHGVPQPRVSVWPVHNTLTPTGPARAASS